MFFHPEIKKKRKQERNDKECTNRKCKAVDHYQASRSSKSAALSQPATIIYYQHTQGSTTNAAWIYIIHISVRMKMQSRKHISCVANVGSHAHDAQELHGLGGVMVLIVPIHVEPMPAEWPCTWVIRAQVFGMHHCIMSD